jgi:hypothetical protein
MKKINFIFIGPSKTASTWIYKALDESEQLSLPKSKDIYYFDQFFVRGESWYHSQFSDCDFTKVVGEFSHDYIISETALKRIKEYNLDIKLIVCVRNPYERTESGVKFLQRNGYGFGALEELVKKHTELINGSLYGKNLEILYKHFNKEQICLLDYELLKVEPVRFLKDICGFLDIDYFEPSIINKKVNIGKAARFRYLSLFIKRMALLARKVGLGSLVGKLKMNKAINNILFKKSDNAYSLSTQDKALLQTYFESDIKLLENLTGFNCDNWK